MKTQRVAIVLTLINLALLALTLSRNGVASDEDVAPVLRAGALEIVDSEGRVRASLSVQPPDTVDGWLYPETVLLRLIDPRNGPIVKITASDQGSAIGLSDDAEGGVQVFARDTGTFVKLISREGREHVIKP